MNRSFGWGSGNNRMNLLARLARFLVWLLVLSWGVSLLRRGIAWALRQRASSRDSSDAAAAQGRRLHRDPVCGMHVAEEIAIPLLEAGQTVHFCSDGCRDSYVASQRFKASA